MGFFALFTGSFSQAAAYRYMRHQAQGLGLRYSFILVALTCFLATLYAIGMIYGGLFSARGTQAPVFDQAMQQLAKQWPQMTLRNGTLSTDAAQPYYVLLDVTVFGHRFAGRAITIDTREGVSHQGIQTPILVTATQVMVKDGENVRSRSIMETFGDTPGTVIFNRHRIQVLADTIIKIAHAELSTWLGTLGLFLWAGLTMAFYIARLCLLLLLAGVGLMLASLQRTQLGFRAAMRLSALAITPVVVADAIALVCYRTMLPNLVLLGLGILMLSVAIRVSHEA